MIEKTRVILLRHETKGKLPEHYVILRLVNAITVKVYGEDQRSHRAAVGDSITVEEAQSLVGRRDFSVTTINARHYRPTRCSGE